MSRPQRWLIASTVTGALFGYAMSALPAPEDAAAFWLGNLCAPWLVLAFFAGFVQRSLPGAVVAGAFADTAAVLGFYAKIFTLNPVTFDLPRSAHVLEVLPISLTHWGAAIAKWVLVAVAVGGISGAIGAHWARTSSAWAGITLGIPFISEAWLWRLERGFFPRPLALWWAESIIGVAIILWIVRADAPRRSARIADEHQSPR